MGGIKDMLSPPCQNMGGIYHPHPPQDLRPWCPGIRKRGGGPKSESVFFLLLNFSGGGGPAQKIAEKMTFSTKKVAKFR